MKEPDIATLVAEALARAQLAGITSDWRDHAIAHFAYVRAADAVEEVSATYFRKYEACADYHRNKARRDCEED